MKSDPVLALITHHVTTPEQAEWMKLNGVPELINNANDRFDLALEEAVVGKARIEKDERLTGTAKLNDIKSFGQKVVSALSGNINDKVTTLKAKQTTVMNKMARLFDGPSDGDAKLINTLVRSEARQSVVSFGSSLNDENLTALRTKAQLDDGSPAELVLWQAAEDGDLVTVGAIANATPTWHRLHRVRPEVIDKAKDRVVMTSDKQGAGELEIIDQLIRGVTRGLGQTKKSIADKLGLPVHEIDGVDPIADMAAGQAA